MIRKIRNQYLNSLIQKYLGRTNQYKQSLGNEKPARKGLKGVWKMRILNFVISQDEFHANGREHSEDVPKYSNCIPIICCVASCFHPAQRSSRYKAIPNPTFPKKHQPSPSRPPNKPVSHLCSSGGRDFLQGLRHTQSGLDSDS